MGDSFTGGFEAGSRLVQSGFDEYFRHKDLQNELAARGKMQKANWTHEDTDLQKRLDAMATGNKDKEGYQLAHQKESDRHMETLMGDRLAGANSKNTPSAEKTFQFYRSEIDKYQMKGLPVPPDLLKAASDASVKANHGPMELPGQNSANGGLFNWLSDVVSDLVSGGTADAADTPMTAAAQRLIGRTGPATPLSLNDLNNLPDPNAPMSIMDVVSRRQ